MGTLLLVVGVLLFFIGLAKALLAALKIRPAYGIKGPLITAAIGFALIIVGGILSPTDEPKTVAQPPAATRSE